MPPIAINWYEGLEPPRPADLEEDRQLPAEGGVLFHGEKGTIMCGVYGDSPRIVPESAMKAYKQPPKTLPRVEGTHEDDWMRAIRTKRKPARIFPTPARSPSSPSSEISPAGSPGNCSKWDAANLTVTNLPEANEWVRRPYREGWSL